MTRIGTPNTTTATKFLLLGAGELGKELAIEAQRLGVEVVAVDRYAHAPAMQVAHRSHITSMLNSIVLRGIIEAEKPDYIVPEIEAIATSTLMALEQEGYTVVPTARAAQLTMDREGIRRLAAENLGLKTSPYCFAVSLPDYREAVQAVTLPCVVKPIMSSSGKGQTILRDEKDIDSAWDCAQQEARAANNKVIVEQFIPFDYEITLLTVRHRQGTTFCAPIGHTQVDGDFRESWQPHPMTKEMLSKAQTMAKIMTDALGGYGVFGVEFFIKGDELYFSEVSPRPHDTGMVTMISQDLSQFALHVRAVLGLPIPEVKLYGPSASHALLIDGQSAGISYQIGDALSEPGTQIRLFGKPAVNGKRRMGVVLAQGKSVEEARRIACSSAEKVVVDAA